ncbi:MAG: T9SS type A sorting domain-containing protein [Bacteroidota bacterium]
MKKLYFLITFFVFTIAFGQNAGDRDLDFNVANILQDNFYINGSITKMQQLPNGNMLVIFDSYVYDELNTTRFVCLNENRLVVDLTDKFEGRVYDFLVQPDGKIVVGGAFTKFNGIVKGKIVRLNTDFTLDITFNNGTGFTHVDNGGSINYPGKLFIDDVGKIFFSWPVATSYNGQNSTNIICVNSNGTIGNVVIPAGSELKFVQSDGKLICLDYNTTTLKRYAQNGLSDSTFNNVVLDSFNNFYYEKISQQSDGKLIIKGSFSSVNGVSRNGICRLNSDGTIDSTFLNINRASDFHINPDGKIIIGGSFSQYGSTTIRNLVRVNIDGTIDTTFGSISGTNSGINKFLVLNDNRILVHAGLLVSNSQEYNSLIRLNSNLTFDNTYANYLKGCKSVSSISEQLDGKILITGSSESYNTSFKKLVFRLNQDGSVDETFNFTNPNTHLTIGNGNPKLFALNDGKVLFMHNNKYIYILNSNGTVYSTRTNGAMSDIYWRSIFKDLSGKYYLCNDLATSNRVVRYNTDHTKDVSFLYSESSFLGEPVAALLDGKLIFEGYTSSNQPGIARFNNNGSFDTVLCLNVGFIGLQSDGKMIVWYDDESGVRKIKRLNSDGTVDNTFNTHVVSTYFDSVNDQPNTANVMPDNTILVSKRVFYDANSTYSTSNLYRLTKDGNLDSTFQTQGSFNNGVSTILIQNNGKILAGGYFTKYNGDKIGGLMRFLGENYYIVKGENRLDSNLNGCDVDDLRYNNLKFNISSGAINFNYVTNTSGSFNIGLKSGNYTLTPSFENPTYFNVTPTSINVSFPAQASPFMQNFCITPNGVHPDIEVVLIPIDPARPGSDAKYKLVYKNKGNQLQSGTVSLNFDDAVLDYVSAVPAASTSATNVRTWNFTNLNPYETREVLVTLNLNSPVESPPLNAGSVLNYTTTITSTQTDETPNDNTFTLNQTVVNSLDPNDKTCMFGPSVGTDKVGEYAHYVIRFENSGTYNAQNINVTDVIDANKFDVNTLVPLSGSALFTTKISGGNKVEFKFDNINLPYTAGTNTGYVAFKIKTKSTLVSGDTFGGLANIYFDYNYPITTNTYTTTIQALSVQDFSFSNYFNLYPNPVSDVLNINKKESIEISSIQIYNVLGQLMMVVPNAKNASTIDVSNLSSGNYFVKINSDKGTSNTRFIKK